MDHTLNPSINELVVDLTPDPSPGRRGVPSFVILSRI